MKVDAHQHYWLYDEQEFSWLEGPYEKLRCDYTPADAWPEMESMGYTKAVAVQARESLDESTFLLDLAARFDHISGVVGWVDLRSEACEVQIEHFSTNPKFKGVRHIAQGQPEGYFENKGFLFGIGLLSGFNLTYDVLVYANQIEEATRFVQKFPAQRFVLDHGGKPPIASGHKAKWEREIRELSKVENVYCKISGLVTEADIAHWKPANLEPYVEVLLESFGPNRLMIGSDWPVSLAAGEYETVMSAYEKLIGTLSQDEQDWILDRTATEFYRLG